MEKAIESRQTNGTDRLRQLAKKAGLLSFWFFFLKGCVWIGSVVVAYVLATM